MPATTLTMQSAAIDEADAEGRLVSASQRGDEAAFAALVRRHQRRVFALAGRFFRAEDVEDVAQETFLLAWRKLGSYRREAPFEHWLTRVCLNLCYQLLRRRRPPEVGLGALELQPVQACGDPTAAVDAARLLARLGARDRFVLLLLDGEGWSTEEIARHLGWSRANVKVRAHRARRRLCKLAQEEIRR